MCESASVAWPPFPCSVSAAGSAEGAPCDVSDKKSLAGLAKNAARRADRPSPRSAMCGARPDYRRRCPPAHAGPFHSPVRDERVARSCSHENQKIPEHDKTRIGEAAPVHAMRAAASVDPSVIVPESLPNVLGQTQYIDDLPRSSGCLQAVSAFRTARTPGFWRFVPKGARARSLGPRILAKDVPGRTRSASTNPTNRFFPRKSGNIGGQPIAIVLASTRLSRRKAANLLRIESEPLPVITDPREAAARGDFIFPPRTIACGDTGEAFSQCAYVVEGKVDSGGQEHVYLETQGAIAQVTDGRRMHVISGTQGPSGVQKAVAQVLGLPMNMVEVEARRLGGASAARWIRGRELGVQGRGRLVGQGKTRRILPQPGKTTLRATGKRHPYSCDFRIARKEWQASGLVADYLQNSGSSCDLSPAILARDRAPRDGRL